MRAFLILLLIANMAYFAWREDWFMPPAAPVAETGQPAFRQAEQALTLLSELSEERRELMGSLAEARAARMQAAEQLQQVQQQVQAVAGDLERNAAELAGEQARSAEVQRELLDTLEAAVAGAAAAGTNAPQVEQTVTAVEPPAQPVVSVQPWCADTSVFAEQSAAAAFAQGAIDLGARASVEVRTAPVSSTWWVHLPPFASEAEARAMLGELQGKGIDSYYMRTGEMAGGISLGVYSREESARIAQRQLASQGYTTSLREVFRMEERPYVRLALPDGGLRTTPGWAALVAAAGPVELMEFACEAVASEIEFP